MTNQTGPELAPEVREPRQQGARDVEIRDVSVHFHVQRGALGGRPAQVRAVDGVNLTIPEGTTLGLVGESGSGKSTMARVIMGMVRPTHGTITFGGIDLQTASKKDAREYRNGIQMVFQDPFSSLNPRMRVRDIVAEPLTLTRNRQRPSAVRGRVLELLQLVGLPADCADRYPHMFSGGQRQRIAIARALSSEPRLLLLDEPSSALDVSVRGQILMLLKDLQRELGLSYLIISHDLQTVAQMATSVGVMYLGRIVEHGDVRDVFRSPAHPYTQALLSSVPEDDVIRAPRLAADYEIPSPLDMPTGCRFKSGCLLRQQLGNPGQCDVSDPPLQILPTGQASACHFPQDAEADWKQLQLNRKGASE
jgi:oligopeptide/dipeptide ABC transporter ATP-binding protein